MLRHRSLWLICISLLSLPLSVSAQTTTGTVQGYIKDPQGAPIIDAQVNARDTRNGQQTSVNSQRNGFYILAGLTPSTYDITVRRIGSAPQARRLDVGVGQSLSLDFSLAASAVELTSVQVVATAAVEMRTSEVATNVTQQQVNNLPSSSRNFLDLASLAPGTSIQNDRLNGVARSLSSGAQSADQINVFVDGASYKNDLIHGGVVGQDRSRGNPFPRNAIQEFRVLTQNYKAAYRTTAATSSGSVRAARSHTIACSFLAPMRGTTRRGRTS